MFSLVARSIFAGTRRALLLKPSELTQSFSWGVRLLAAKATAASTLPRKRTSKKSVPVVSALSQLGEGDSSDELPEDATNIGFVREPPEVYKLLQESFPDHAVLYQKGKFYEMWGADSEALTSALPLRMTASGMSGFPMDRAPQWVPQILTAGFTVILVDQVIPDLASSALPPSTATTNTTNTTNTTSARSSAASKKRPSETVRLAFDPDSLVHLPLSGDEAVLRQLTRIITPGTRPADMQEDTSSNIVLSLFAVGEDVHLCWVDSFTGEVHVSQTRRESVTNEIARISPKEIVIVRNDDNDSRSTIRMRLPSDAHKDIRELPAYAHAAQLERYGLLDLGGVYVTGVHPRWIRPPTSTQLAEYYPAGSEKLLSGPQAAVACVAAKYLKHTMRAFAPTLGRPGEYHRRAYVEMDAATREGLELLTSTSQRKSATLLWLLDHTVSKPGLRLLRQHIAMPLTDLEEIRARQALVAAFVSDPVLSKACKEQLKRSADLPRLLQQLRDTARTGSTLSSAIPAALAATRATLQAASALAAILARSSGSVAAAGLSVNYGAGAAAAAARVSAVSVGAGEGGVNPSDGRGWGVNGKENESMRSKVSSTAHSNSSHAEAGALLATARGLSDPRYTMLLTRLNAMAETPRVGECLGNNVSPAVEQARRETERLRETFLKLFRDYRAQLSQYAEFAASGSEKKLQLVVAEDEGHVLETLKAFGDLFDKENFIRLKPRGASVLRFTTPALSKAQADLEQQLDILREEELAFVRGLVSYVTQHSSALLQLTEQLAGLDVAVSLATASRAHGFVRPMLTHEPVLVMEGGFHPVVNAMQPAQTFVRNDCTLTNKSLWLITGPNMGGKSTFLRQQALAVIMAQMGCFVPATRALIGLTDRIFTRIGASDNLSENQSTFMLEMVETAHIMRHATRQSLVLLDEIGRGTGVPDGLAIASALVHHLAGTLGCRTLFATHFHQLSALSSLLPTLACYHVELPKLFNDSVIFSHRIIPGAVSESQGLVVARLAGLPPSILAHASTIKEQVERSRTLASIAQPLQTAISLPAPHPTNPSSK